MKEIEDIIKTKSFIELTTAEQKAVSEWVDGEEAFNEMKWFLNKAEEAVSAEKIEATPKLKKGVMAHLTDAKKKKGFWLNSTAVVNIKQKRKFYQKPAFQLALAACLIVGVLFIYNGQFKEQTLAQNNVEKDQITPPAPATNDNESPVSTESKLDEVQVLEEKERKKIADFKEDDNNMSLEKRELAVEPDKEYITEDMGTVPPTPDAVNNTNYFNTSPLAEKPEEELIVSEDEAVEEAVVTMVSPSSGRDEYIVEQGAYKDETSKKKTRFRNDKKATVYANNEQVNTDDEIQETSAPQLGNIDEGSGVITPKSLHINRTDELNQFFYTVK